MFNDSKYTKHYFKLIEKSKLRQPIKMKGCHRHHIIPKCLGGNDELSNIAILTYKEHYIAHLLLVKMTDGKNRSKMAFALKRFSGKNQTAKSVSLMYKLISTALSGPGNPMFGKHLTDEHKAKISGDKHGMFNKSCVDIWIEKFGIEHAKQLKKEMVAKRSESLKGHRNPQFGKPRTPSQKDKQTLAISGRIGMHLGNKRIRVAITQIPGYLNLGYSISQKHPTQRKKIISTINQYYPSLLLDMN